MTSATGGREHGQGRRASAPPRIAIVGPSFFSYVPAIAKTFRGRGFEVAVFDEKHSNRPLAKLLYRTGLARRWRPAAEHVTELLQAVIGTGASDVFLINVETIDRGFIAALAARGVRAHLYMWDGIANKPGFASLLEVVTSKGSFDPDDCVRFGMRYIPLFAEPIFDTAREQFDGAFSCDIGFCGTVHSARTAAAADLLDAARHGGPKITLMLYYHSKVLLYFKGLTQPKVWRIARIISYRGFPKEAIARLFATSRLSLDMPHHGQAGLTARTFEVLAAGGRLLTTHRRARELLPQFAERIVPVRGVADILRLNFGAFPPLPELREDERRFLSIERFVDDLLELAGLRVRGEHGTRS